jgi:valyl-tRNA synthetase
MRELVDLEKETARLNRELASAQADLERVQSKLANENFTRRAPAQVVATERERAEKLNALIVKINESLLALR